MPTRTTAIRTIAAVLLLAVLAGGGVVVGELRSTTARLEAAEARADDLTLELDRTTAELAQLEASVVQQASLEADVDRLRADLADTEVALDTVASELASTEAALKVSRRANATLTATTGVKGTTLADVKAQRSRAVAAPEPEPAAAADDGSRPCPPHEQSNGLCASDEGYGEEYAGEWAPAPEDCCADTPASPAEQQAVASSSSGIGVSRVVDGDTIELADGRRVRFAIVNAPERNAAGGSQAHEFTRSWLAARGNVVELRRPSSAPQTDRYGRTIAEVLSGGESLNVALCGSGNASIDGRFTDEDPDLTRRLRATEGCR